MDVSITHLRADLASWVARAQSGEDVLITDRGIPVARLCAVDASPLVDRLVREGVLTRPENKTRTASKDIKRARASGLVSEYIGENRR